MSNQANEMHFFDYCAMMERLHRLSDTYSFLTLSYIGTSILDRAIPILHIGNGSRRVLYVGAHHGMEWLTSLVLTRFLEEFCEVVKEKKRVCGMYPCDLLDGYTLSVLPMLNPDGVEYQIHGVRDDNPLRERLLAMNGGSEDFSNWQANARGVDLNHNYDAGFAEYKKIEAENGIKKGAPTRYSGQEPESEPEIRALCNFIRFQKDLRLILSLHTQGEEIFCKASEGAITRNFLAISKISSLTGYKISEAEGPAAYGGLTDWCIQKQDLPALTLECGKGVNPLPLSDHTAIYQRLRETLFVAPTLF